MNPVDNLRSTPPQDSPTRREELAISGMDCASCAAGIERTLRRLGLTDATVNFATSSAFFTPGDAFPTSKVVIEIEKLGYKVRSKDPGGSSSQRFGPNAEDTRLAVMALVSLLLSLPLFLHMFLPPWHLLHNGWAQLALCTPVMALGYYQFGKSAWGSLKAGFPNMDVLIVTGVTAAYGYSAAGLALDLGPNYLFFETAATIICLVFIGNFLERRSVRKAASAIEELSQAQQSVAKKVISTSPHIIQEIPADAVQIGDLLQVNTGDKICADGSITSGDLFVDESIITGESTPLHRAIGQKVLGGSSVHAGSGFFKATGVGEETVLGEIVKLVREAQGDKPSIQRLGDIVSAYFTPVVITIAILTFLVSFFLLEIPSRDALLRSVAVLVVACPCAMGLATPTAVMVGVGRAARIGILIRGGAVLERLATCKTIIFDKTGTLTTGEFKVGAIESSGISEDLAKSYILGLENHSSHPIAKSIVAAFQQVTPYSFKSIREMKGFGMIGTDSEGASVTFGASNLPTGTESAPRDGSLILAKNGEIISRLRIEDQIKQGAKEVVDALKVLGVQPVILSGDFKEKCQSISKELGIELFYSEQSPEQKLQIVRSLQEKGALAFIGDGVNDAPGLAAADVGISMSDGTHLAIKSSDVVLLNGSLDRLVTAVALARATLTTIKQNLFWAFSYNLVAIPIAALGLLSPIVAAFAMGFSDVMTIGNSLRLRTKSL